MPTISLARTAPAPTGPRAAPRALLAALIAGCLLTTGCPAPAASPAAATATDTAAAALTAPPAVDPAVRFAAYGHPGAWLLRSDGAAARVLHGDALAAKAQRPASTFKVLLALVALETGALRDAAEVVPWGGHGDRVKPEWRKDMALDEAMRTSSEPYFAVLATRVGHARLAEWVARAGYGNGRIGPDPARAWHDGVLTVTAHQQLEFIDRLRRGDVPFSATTIATVKAAMLEQDRDGRRLYGKTGTQLHDGDGNGWWIGWVEGGGAPAASFALAVHLDAIDGRDRRVALGNQLLRDAGINVPR